MPIKIAVARQQCVEWPLYRPNPGRVNFEPALKPARVRSSMRLKYIELPTDSRVVNDVEFQATHNLVGRIRKRNPRSRSGNRVTCHAQWHRSTAEALAHNVQLVIELGDGLDKLPAPLGHPAAAPIKLVDNKADSHQAARFHERWSMSFAL